MYKVLIVDDERLIREGLARHIRWNEMGMELLGTAEDARHALEIISQTPPDLLITDIRMPQQDGFELIQDVLEMGLSPQVVLISSYDDFIYAQRAVRYDIIRDYVLKPIDISRFTDILSGLRPYLDQNGGGIGIDSVDIENYKAFLHSLRLGNYDRYKLLSLMKVGDRDKALEFWNIARKTIVENSYPISTQKRFCAGLIMSVFSDGLYNSGSEGSDDDPVKTIYSSLSGQEELLGYMEQFITGCCLSSLKKRGNEKSKLITACLDIIDKEYCSQDFNLTALAARLNVTPNYLSIKFKEELGVGFMKYLVEKQMERAKELLTDVKYKIYEVSYMTGYADEKYFTRTFKKYAGISPKEYREHIKSTIL